jgi:hypothetical protein
MPLTPESLEAVLHQGDDTACLQLCLKASEAERKAVASLAAQWAAAQAKQPVVETGPGRFASNPLLSAAQVAALACCSIGQLKKLGWRSMPDEEQAYAILTDRRPAWIDDWVESIALETPWRWGFVRRLVREGLCQRPVGDNYILGMLGRGFAHSGKGIRQILEADPDLLDYEVWRILEVEGNGEFSLAAHDKYSRLENTWATAFVELSVEGKMSRTRLLDASLSALERDFAQFRAGWFSRFHETLKPTLEERVQRAGRYLILLGSRIPPTVSFALKALQVLDKAERLPAVKLLEHIQPAFAARQMGTVKIALGFLDRAARRDAGLKPQVAIAAVEALAHEAPEVQSAALDFIENHGAPGAPELVGRLQDKLAGLAASQQPRLLAWLGSAGKTEEAPAGKPLAQDAMGFLKRAAKIERRLAKLVKLDAAVAAVRACNPLVPAVEFEGTEIPHLHPEKAVQPLQTLDDLIDLFAGVLENARSADDVERVLDGVSRLCAERPDDFVARSGPLNKRAQALLKRWRAEPFIARGPEHDLCGVAIAWITGEVRQGTRDQTYPAKPIILDFLSARALAVARRASRQQAAPLLSAPTHMGGWLDPLHLVERIKTWEGLEDAPDVYDQVQSLLRLAPHNRAGALRKAGKLAGEYGAAVRYALGADKIAIGPTAPLWVAAARARDPFGDAPALAERHPELGPDAALAARYSYRIKSKEHRGDYQTASGPKHFHHTFYTFYLDLEPALPKKVAVDLPTVLLHAEAARTGAAPHRSAALVWPLARESWFATGAQCLAQNLDWWEANWGNRTYLELLLDADVPLKPMAVLALMFGLAAKERGESGLATDALIAAIDDGRLDDAKLGEALNALLPTGMVKAARLAKTLGDAGRISPLHLHVIAAAIERALQHEPAKAPRDLVTLLELLHELLVSTGLTLSASRTKEYLSALEAGGKTAKLIAKLLALETAPSRSRGGEAACYTLERRLERAERWTRAGGKTRKRP